MATAVLNPPNQSTTETLVEFITSGGEPLKVDREKGIIRRVKILGLESKNGRSYSAAGVKAAIPLYEGAKVNVNHPRGNASQPRDYGDRLGSVRNVEFREGAGLYGDLHFNPKHALAEQLIHDAEHSPENVGLSHNVEARTTKRDGKTVVESILRVQSVDLVADPATTGTLFEHIETNPEPEIMALEKVTLEELKSARPDLAQALLQEQAQSAEQKAKDEQIKTLKEENDKLKTAQALAARKEVVDGKITEAFKGVAADVAKIVLTDTFRESCYEAADDVKLGKLIEDRQAMVKVVKPAPGTSRPQSRDQGVTEGVGGTKDYSNVKDAKSFAAALR